MLQNVNDAMGSEGCDPPAALEPASACVPPAALEPAAAAAPEGPKPKKRPKTLAEVVRLSAVARTARAQAARNID